MSCLCNAWLGLMLVKVITGKNVYFFKNAIQANIEVSPWAETVWPWRRGSGHLSYIKCFWLGSKLSAITTAKFSLGEPGQTWKNSR